MYELKTKLIHNLATLILRQPLLEETLRQMTLNPFLRETLKLKIIPIAGTYVFDRPELRIAQIGDYQLYVNIAEPSGICLYFFGYHYEPFAAQLVHGLLNPGDTCIDIGANIGSYTFTMADRVGKTGKVFAFEPQPALLTLLKDSVGLNQADHLIHLDSRAIWHQTGAQLPFFLSQDIHNSGVSSLVNHGCSITSEKSIQVETMTLTDFFQEQTIDHCRLVKIDVERAEFQVLQGMQDLLMAQAIDYILLEQLAGSEAQSLLTTAGYVGWFVDEIKKSLIPLDKIPVGTFGNYWFISSQASSTMDSIESHVHQV